MSIQNEMAKSVLGLISTMGQSLTLRRTAEGAYNPATGTTAATTTTDVTVSVAFVDYAEGLFSGGNIIRGDRKALISALDSCGVAITLSPQPQDQIIGEGSTVQVVASEDTKVGDKVVAYICQVRGP